MLMFVFGESCIFSVSSYVAADGSIYLNHELGFKGHLQANTSRTELFNRLVFDLTFL